jgi:hypothetical protein
MGARRLHFAGAHRWCTGGRVATLRIMEPRKTESSVDAGVPRFVTASIEEIRFAEELRRQIERRYLGPSVDAKAPSRAMRAD